MQIEVVEVGSFSRKLQFKVPADRITRELDAAYRSVGRQARLKGFRQGKAPRRVLEMRFGPQVAEDVARKLIQEGYTTAIQDRGIDPVSQPQLEPYTDVAKGSDFDFSITVDVRPSIELETVTGIDVVYPPVNVADEEIEAMIRARLEGQARLVEVSDRAVQAGDMVITELHALDGEEEVATEPGTMIRTEADPYYPGVDAMVIGLEVGGEKTEEITFAEDVRTDAVAGKTVSVRVKILGIQANEIPDLTDAIAEELGYEGGADGMRTAIRLEIETQKTDMARNQARANLLQALIGANPFDVPAGMVDQRLAGSVSDGHVDHVLGINRHTGHQLGQGLSGIQHDLENLQGCHDAVTGGGLVQADDMPGCLSTQHPLVGDKFFMDMAVAYP